MSLDCPEMLLGNPEMFLDFPATKQTILSRLQTLLVMSVDVEAAALVTSAAFIVIQQHKRARQPKRCPETGEYVLKIGLLC